MQQNNEFGAKKRGELDSYRLKVLEEAMGDLARG